MAFSPDGKTLATGSDDRTVKLWDLDGLATGSASWEAGAGEPRLGREADSGGGRAPGRLGASGSERQRRGPGPGTLTGHQHPVGYVAFSSDGRTVAAGTGWSWTKFFGLGREGSVTLWDSLTKKEAGTLGGLKGTSGPVTFSPDGKLLAAGSGDRTVKVWDVATRRPIVTLEGHTGRGVLGVAFSPEGTTLGTAGFDGTLKLWDVASGRLQATLRGHTNSATTLAFAPDLKTLATGSFDNTVRLWDIPAKREVATLKGHSNMVSSLAFSPDGKTLATGSWDTTVRLWNVLTRREVATLRGHTDYVHSVAFSPDGNLLASGSQDHTVRLWRAAAVGETDGLSGALLHQAAR